MPSSRKPSTKVLIAAVAGALAVVVGLVAGIVWLALPRERTTEVPWGIGSLSASIVGVDVQITDALIEPAAAEAMANLVPTEYFALRPQEISASGPIPESGVRLTWNLPSPLPADAAITFAYFDEELGVWWPEYTVVSEDRRSVSTVVDHLSIWDVFASGVGEFAAGVGALVEDVVDMARESFDRGSKQLFRFSHELLGNAADTPECSPATPWWVAESLVSDSVEIDLGVGAHTGGIAAVLLCVGQDPSDSQLLEVKAAANRGYGFPVVFADGIEPVSAGISSMDSSLASVFDAGMAFFFDGAGDLSMDPSRFVLATQEYTATIDEASVRAAGGGRIASFELPNLMQVAVSSTLKLTLEEVGEGSDVVAGILGVVAMVQNCDLGQLNVATDAAATIVWLNACVSTIDADNVAGAAGVIAEDVFAADHPEIASRIKADASIVRKVLSKLKFLMIFSVAQTIIDYFGDWVTEDVSSYPAWFVQLMLKPEPPALQTLFGQYGRCGNALAADGIWQSAVNSSECGWGDDFRDEQTVVSSEWDGTCYVIELQTSSRHFDASQRTPETWFACPAGFGGPGDDTQDRLGIWWAHGKKVSNWAYRQ